MKNFFLALIFFLFSSTSLLAEYRLEPVNCTLKKKSNCGAYLYNSSTGATYFCDSEKCTEIIKEEHPDLAKNFLRQQIIYILLAFLLCQK